MFVAVKGGVVVKGGVAAKLRWTNAPIWCVII